MSLLVATASLLVLALVLLCVIGYRLGYLPNRPPRNFAYSYKRRGALVDEDIIVCVGDSNTFGSFGIDYTQLLQNEHRSLKVLNAGKNGATTFLLKEKSMYEPIIDIRPKYLVILIGTNDISLELAPAGSMTHNLLSKQVKDKSIIPSEKTYDENTTKLLEIYINSGIKPDCITIASVPLYGDTINENNILYRKAASYSAIVKRIAENQGVHYLPLFETQKEYLEALVKANPNEKLIELKAGQSSILFKAMWPVFGLGKDRDAVGRSYGFHLHTDGIHFNTTTAKQVVRLINSFLSRQK